jgi:hypothetical protein
MLYFHDQGKKKETSFAVLSELQLHYESRRDGYWTCFSPKESLLSASQYIRREDIKNPVPTWCQSDVCRGAGWMAEGNCYEFLVRVWLPCASGITHLTSAEPHALSSAQSVAPTPPAPTPPPGSPTSVPGLP